MKKPLLLLLIFCSILLQFTNAQKIDSMMSVYAEKYPQEKIYLHYDKSSYAKGETIWYKAYLMTDVYPSGISKNFYTDVFDESGKLLTHIAAPIYNASARGQFNIPDDYKGKSLRIKAYTQWMLNFDTAFIYNKTITINAAATAKRDTIKPKATIYFFPEGGDLVEGVEGRVAVKVMGSNGKPVAASGYIKNQKGTIIDSFATVHDGMGLFSVVPQKGDVLTAIWTDEWNIPHESKLPQALTKGIVLQVQPLSQKVLFVLKRADILLPEYTQVNVVAHINQNIVYQSRVNFTKSATIMSHIPVKDFQSGILQITVFNEKFTEPLAERIVFINHAAIPTNEPEVRLIKKGFGKRAKNQLEIYVNDTLSNNMSLSVTDADLPADKHNNIISHMLLSSEIKGYVHQPAYYFNSSDDSVKQHLDLVMLTNGWRRFNWADVLNGITPKIEYPRDSDYLQIKGKVFGHAFEKRNNVNINLILQSRDSSRQFLFLKVEPKGDFVQRGVFFYDTIKAYYQFNGDKRLTDIATVTINSGLLDAHRKRLQPAVPLFENYFFDSATIKRNQFFANEKERINKLLKAQMLDEVTVKTKTKSAVERLDAQYASGMFSGGDSYQFDMMNDPLANAAIDIFQYLQGRVAGLQIDNSGGEVSLSWRGASPDLYLDEMRITDASQIQNVPVANIAYVKVFRPPFFGSIGGGAGGAIVVYTKKGADATLVPGQGMGFLLVGGYTKYKEFFSPDYETDPSTMTPDIRSTLMWKPYLLTNKRNKVVRVDFFNNDVTKRFRLVLEGMNTDGRFIQYEKVFE